MQKASNPFRLATATQRSSGGVALRSITSMDDRDSREPVPGDRARRIGELESLGPDGREALVLGVDAPGFEDLSLGPEGVRLLPLPRGDRRQRHSLRAEPPERSRSQTSSGSDLHPFAPLVPRDQGWSPRVPEARLDSSRVLQSLQSYEVRSPLADPGRTPRGHLVRGGRGRKSAAQARRDDRAEARSSRAYDLRPGLRTHPDQPVGGRRHRRGERGQLLGSRHHAEGHRCFARRVAAPSQRAYCQEGRAAPSGSLQDRWTLRPRPRDGEPLSPTCRAARRGRRPEAIDRTPSRFLPYGRRGALQAAQHLLARIESGGRLSQRIHRAVPRPAGHHRQLRGERKLPRRRVAPRSNR